MSRKLYKVEVTFEVYVAAENELEAELVAGEFVHEENYAVDFLVEQITSVNSIDEKWIGALPYSNKPHDERACEDYINEDVTA